MELDKRASNMGKDLAWNPQGKRKRGIARDTERRDSEADMQRSGHCWKDVEYTAQRKRSQKVELDRPASNIVGKGLAWNLQGKRKRGIAWDT